MTKRDDTRLSVGEVAGLLGVTERTVRNYLARKRNRLPHTRPGGRGKILIWKGEFEQWAKTR